MATLHFAAGTTEYKTFTPVSAALGALSNGPGTIIVLVKQTTTGSQDFCGLLNSAGSTFYHGLTNGAITTSRLCDDIGPSSTDAAATWPQDTTNWYLIACDWAATAATENYHWRSQTSLGAWTNSASSGSGSAAFAGPGTTGRFRLGFFGDGITGVKDQAIVAVWNARFSNSDYSTAWNKTSDLWNHPLGNPIFLCELTSATPVDLAGGSTYSSANSSGTALTGADPDNWTFDGIGTPAAVGSTRFLPRRLGPRASGPLFFVPAPRQASVDVLTSISDTDSGIGTETSDVQATVPGSDTSTGTDTGTVSATVPDSDTATGTDAASALTAAVPASDSATGTDASSASVTGTGSDTGSGSESASTFVTLSSSDSATGTDDQVSIVSPVAGADTAAGTETDSTSAAVPGSDTATGSEAAVVTATDPGGEAGAGLDSGTVSATVPGADTAAGTDIGTVADITGGPTTLSDTDAGTGTETGTVTDLTPPPEPAPAGGGVFEGEEDTSETDFRVKTGADRGYGTDAGFVVDLTPQRRFDPLRVILPSRRRRQAKEARDTAAGRETDRIRATMAAHDLGRGRDEGMVVDLTAEEEDERLILGLLGIDL